MIFTLQQYVLACSLYQFSYILTNLRDLDIPRLSIEWVAVNFYRLVHIQGRVLTNSYNTVYCISKWLIAGFKKNVFSISRRQGTVFWNDKSTKNSEKISVLGVVSWVFFYINIFCMTILSFLVIIDRVIKKAKGPAYMRSESLNILLTLKVKKKGFCFLQCLYSIHYWRKGCF